MTTSPQQYKYQETSHWGFKAKIYHERQEITLNLFIYHGALLLAIHLLLTRRTTAPCWAPSSPESWFTDFYAVQAQERPSHQRFPAPGHPLELHRGCKTEDG